MTKLSTLHKRWAADPEYDEAFESHRLEFELARQLIQRRLKSGLSQQELASRMGTSQSSIARMESGTALPSLRTLQRFAEATESVLKISFKSQRKLA